MPTTMSYECTLTTTPIAVGLLYCSKPGLCVSRMVLILTKISKTLLEKRGSHRRVNEVKSASILIKVSVQQVETADMSIDVWSAGSLAMTGTSVEEGNPPQKCNQLHHRGRNNLIHPWLMQYGILGLCSAI